MANQNSGITVISKNAMLDSATSHVVEANTHVSDYLLEDVPHLSDYITDLPVCSELTFSLFASFFHHFLVLFMFGLIAINQCCFNC
jgi:hypothetical protein